MHIASLAHTLAASAVMAGMLGCGSDPNLGVPPATCSTYPVNAGHSDLMEPGGACISCHANYDGPSFALGGSVMNALHDDTNCAGVANVTVAITGGDGTRVELVSNANGNLSLQRWPGTNLYPYTAEIMRDGVSQQDDDSAAGGRKRLQLLPRASGAQRGARRIIMP